MGPDVPPTRPQRTPLPISGAALRLLPQSSRRAVGTRLLLSSARVHLDRDPRPPADGRPPGPGCGRGSVDRLVRQLVAARRPLLLAGQFRTADRDAAARGARFSVR